MSVASSYARALYDLIGEEPSKSTVYIKNLKQSLAKRGYVKLLPNILSEYQKLAIGQARAKRYMQVTPEKERVRVLLGLYKKLIEAK